VRFLVRNLLGNYLVYALSIVSAIVLTPVIISAIGTEEYGVWAFILSLTVILRVLDFGIAPTIVRDSAFLRGRGAPERIGELASCGLFLYVAVGLVSLALGLVIAWFVPELIGLDAELEGPARAAAVIAVVTLATELPLTLFGNLLKGQQRYDLFNAAAVVSLAVYVVLILAVLTTRSSLPMLAGITLVATLVRLALPVVFVRRELPDLRLSPRLVTPARLRELVSFSGYTFLSHVAGKIVFSVDTILIGFVLGAEPVALYAVAARLFAVAASLSATGSDLLFPAYSELEGSGERRRQLAYVASGLRVTMCVTVLAAGPLLVLPDWIFAAWLGDDFEESALVLALLAAALLFGQPARVLAQYLLARGRPRGLAFSQFGLGVANLVLTTTLLLTVGEIWVAAAATLVFEAASGAVAIPLLVGRDGVGYGALVSTWLRPVAAGVAAAAVTLVPAALLTDSEGLAGLLAVTALWTVAFGAVAWRVGLGEPERQAVRRVLTAVRSPLATAQARPGELDDAL
jgi:O-antigen/teichoic acid export membrane protein